MVAHIITVLFSGFMIYTAWPGSSLFSWHPTLMTLAFVVGMFEAMLVFNRESSIFVNMQRPTKVLIHHVLQVFAVVCSLTGFTVIYYNKVLNEKPHFTSWHGLLGIITVCAIPLAALGGNIVKYQFLRDLFKIKISLGKLKIYHATAGLVVFTLVMFTIMLGLYSDWFVNQVSSILWYISAMSVSFMAVVVMNQVTQEYLPRAQGRVPVTSLGPASAAATGNRNTAKFSSGNQTGNKSAKKESKKKN
ncbi:C56D1-like protein [Mya arenaria]|uniref:ascorbate ferrireductase (transmembrane) n=1 Tax=Mya arenaria TaxID=6604 RepID=A0ABY7FZ21_MYAAR|nr:transmembrane reductase CYB561D2-like [Mya arenaria]WAR26534.1 C56D1-like protein [Mya arenaria]